jgi:hypothetical protein
MATKKAKKYEGGGTVHDTIPGQYNSMTGMLNPPAQADVEAIPVAEPRRMEPREEVDVLGEFINKLQAEKSSRAEPRATPRAAPRAAPAPRRPVMDRSDVDAALAEAAAQAQMDYDNPPRRRATPPYVYGGPSPISDLRDLARAPANRRAAKRAADKLGVSAFKKGGSVKSGASKRADGCAVRGKTKGRMV